MTAKMKRTLYLPVHSISWVEAQARRLDRSVSWVVEQAITSGREALEQMPAPRPAPLPPRSLGEILRQARLRSGLRPEQVAECVGVGVERVRAWEADERAPHAGQWVALVNVLDLDDREPVVRDSIQTAWRSLAEHAPKLGRG